jgi:VWFA-related protein
VTGAWTAAVVLASSVQAPAEPPRFESAVESVYVDAFVTRKGKPVGGLTAQNFEVLDNGVRQDIRLVSLDLVPVAVFLVFDTSYSVAGPALGHLRAAGHAVLDGLRPGERAALVTFNHEVVVRVPPTDDLARVRSVLDVIRGQGSTALYDAAYAGLVLPDRGARSVIVLFSDGEDNASWLGPEEVRAVAARSDVLLQAVGVDDTISVSVPEKTSRAGALPPGGRMRYRASVKRAPSPRVAELQRIAESTGGRFWTAEKTERLEKTFLRMLEELRSRYLLVFEPTGVERAGEHRLDVRLKGTKGHVRSRTSYYVTPSR